MRRPEELPFEGGLLVFAKHSLALDLFQRSNSGCQVFLSAGPSRRAGRQTCGALFSGLTQGRTWLLLAVVESILKRYPKAASCNCHV